MPKNAQANSEDIRAILAVVDQGSVAAAARVLQVNHATILRRIADFETRTGVHMFDKTTRGYQVSPDRSAMIDVMRDAIQGLHAVDQLLDRARPTRMAGLRLTTTDTLAHYILPRILPALITELDVPVEVMVDNAHVDFARVQAQLTVRPALSLPSDIDGVPAGYVRFAVYGTGADDTAPWLGLTGPLARTVAADWVRAQADQIAAFGDSFLALAAMAAAGLGRTVLPVYVGEACSPLTCLERPDALPPVPVWVGSHSEYGRSRLILKSRKWLATELAEMPDLK